MANFNKVMLLGNLTRDPEMRYTKSGTAIVQFGLAVNRKYRSRNSDEMTEETTYIDIEGWGNQAETFNQYMSKGRPVFIEGRLRFDSWESKEGQKRSKLVVVMENFQFLSTGAGGRDSSDRRSGGGRPARSNAGGGGAGGGGSGGGGSGGGDQVQAGRVADRGDGPPADDYDFDDIPF